MTYTELDAWLATQPRMKDSMKADDLNTDGVLDLVTEILDSASEALRLSVIHLAHNPNEASVEHSKACMRFYTSDLFAAYSMGLANGETVMRKIVAQAWHKLPREGKTATMKGAVKKVLAQAMRKVLQERRTT